MTTDNWLGYYLLAGPVLGACLIMIILTQHIVVRNATSISSASHSRVRKTTSLAVNNTQLLWAIALFVPVANIGVLALTVKLIIEQKVKHE